MPKTGESLDNTNISPVRPKTKYNSTPLRTRRKTSRRDQDVHTATTSTPTATHKSPRLRLRQDSPQLLNSEISSPSSSFPCSQDNCPDVVWDFTSPKLPKGARKREMKITVQELLENLNQGQPAECDSKTNPYIKLLENWMSKQPTDVAVRETRSQKKDIRKRTKHRVEELKKFIETLQRSKKENSAPLHLKSPSEGSNKKTGEDSLLEQNTSFKNSFIEGAKSDDSSEELWGDVDNSFIVKATQELDKVNVAIPAARSNHIEELISTIPETVPNPPVPNSNSPVIKSNKRSCEEQAEILLHLSNIDWDCDDDDEWDKGFILEDEDLSLIPDEVLSGQIPNNKDTNISSVINGIQSNPVTVSVANAENKETESNLLLKETEFGMNGLNSELYNSFEDGSLEEESLLCQPEVLSKLDEVESMLSQPKCTPEEIKKKKEEALKRRKRTQLKRKN